MRGWLSLLTVNFETEVYVTLRLLFPRLLSWRSKHLTENHSEVIFSVCYKAIPCTHEWPAKIWWQIFAKIFSKKLHIQCNFFNGNFHEIKSHEISWKNFKQFFEKNVGSGVWLKSQTPDPTFFKKLLKKFFENLNSILGFT